MASNRPALSSRRIDVPDSYDAIQDYYEDQGWTDGMPVVPATEDAVRRMLGAWGEDPAQSLGVAQPSNQEVTLEKVAINAVMAGCRPEYFPVVVACVKAALQASFNLAGCQATTGGAAPVIIVNGPLTEQLGINGDSGCFGPGYRSNATIGRALRLFVRNVAGLIIGDMDKATLAMPGRYSFCFAENESRSPWEPRHVELGMDPDDSMITLHAIRAFYPIMETTVSRGIDVLHTLVQATRATGFSNYYQIGTGAQVTLVISPEHAAEIAADGLTKKDVREYIYTNARMSIRELSGLGHWANRNYPAWIDDTKPDTMVPIALQADDIVIVVAGGDGRHSAWLAGWGVTRVVSQRIEIPA
jgi:hypothetical protein